MGGRWGSEDALDRVDVALWVKKAAACFHQDERGPADSVGHGANRAKLVAAPGEAIGSARRFIFWDLRGPGLRGQQRDLFSFDFTFHRSSQGFPFALVVGEDQLCDRATRGFIDRSEKAGRET